MAGPGINLCVVLIIAVLVAVGSWAKAESFKAFRADLIRRDSPLSPLLDGRNLSNAERQRRAIERSHHRLRRIQSFIAGSAGSGHSMSYYSPLNAEEHEFLMQLAIGSPVPLNLNFIADTGSDLIWTQCQPCGNNSCLVQTDPMYNPMNSSSYTNISCSSNFCSDLTGQCDTQTNCVYNYEYGDYSDTYGILGYETFSLATLGSSRLASFRHLAFGCGRQQSGDFSNSTGIVGLGRGPLSFVSQIRSSINSIFSYCLGSIYNSSQASPLIFGNAGLPSSGNGVIGATPLIRNDFFPTFYYLALSGISVAGKLVRIPLGTFDIEPEGRGGLFIDSGTTITYLQDAAYGPFLAAVRSSINGGQEVNVTATTGLDLCYKATPALRLPAITFYFAGNAPYALPTNNSFVFTDDGTDDIVCLAFAPAGPQGSTAIFGNVQQQNFHIVYDLQHNMLYFAQQNCASM